MPGFIKTAADERLWNTAKDRARAAAEKGGVYNVWGLANSIFHKMKSGAIEEEVVPSVTTDAEKGSVNNILEDECWKDIKHYVFNHPVYGTLSEEELYNAVDECYSSYVQNNKDLSSGPIYEFVNSYMSGGIGSALGAGNIMGGWRDEKPIGPIVYGLPGNNLEPMRKDKVEPAVVEIPDQQSNYKPWETELNADGEAISDIERNKVISQDRKAKSTWENSVEEIGDELEDSGVDVDDLSGMTQEEIEDVLKKIIKQQAAQSNNQEAKAAISKLKEVKNKIMEAFAWELDEDLIGGKTRKAREILAKKHQVKKALERDDRRFLLDKLAIERLMRKYGYVFSLEKNDWVKRLKKSKYAVAAPEPKKEVKREPEELNFVPVKKDTDKKAEDEKEIPKKINKQESEPDDDHSKDDEEKIDDNPLSNPEIRNKMRVLQARFILAVGHDDKTANTFVKKEISPDNIEEHPEIADEEILSKFELLGYHWEPEKLIWNSANMNLPNQMFDKQESQKTVVARSFLAASGQLSAIKTNESGNASIQSDTILEKMNHKGFVFNAEVGMWNWVGKPETSSINESEIYEDQIINEKDNEQDDEVKIGYNKRDSLDLQARFLLRAYNLTKYSEIVSAHANQLILDQKWAQIQDKNPVEFKNNINNPKMEVSDIENTLLSSKTPHADNELGEIPVWTQNGELPKVLSKIGETIESLSARAILAAETKNPQYIQFDDAAGKRGTVKPKYSKPRVEQFIKDKDRNFIWNKKYGWIKQAGQRNINAEQSNYEEEARQFMRKYSKTNWSYLNSANRKLYKEYSAYVEGGILKYLGLDENEWPAGDDANSKNMRNSYLRKFSQMHKFIVDEKTGEKMWIRRTTPVTRTLDNVGFKAAIGSVGRALLKTGKAGAWLGGLAATILSAIDKETGSVNDGRHHTGQPK